jgi:hypothetical protein
VRRSNLSSRGGRRFRNEIVFDELRIAGFQIPARSGRTTKRHLGVDGKEVLGG